MVHVLGKACAEHCDGRVGRVEAELRGPWVEGGDLTPFAKGHWTLAFARLWALQEEGCQPRVHAEWEDEEEVEDGTGWHHAEAGVSPLGSEGIWKRVIVLGFRV